MPRKKRNKPEVLKNSSSIYEAFYKQVEKMNAPEKFDRSKPGYREKIKSICSAVYDEQSEKKRKEYQQNCPDERWFEKYKDMKLDAPYRNRKIKAELEILIRITEKFENKYPDFSIERELCGFFSSTLTRNPETIDRQCDLTLAAAIFILDSILKSNNYDRAVYFIPHDERVSCVKLPDRFQDAVFSNDVIKGVMYLIRHRHGSSETFWTPETVAITPEKSVFCEYGSYIKNVADDEDYIRLSEEYYMDAEKLSDSQRYYALISFIRPEIIERAVQRIYDFSFEFFDIILEKIEECKQKSQVLIQKIKKEIAVLEQISSKPDNDIVRNSILFYKPENLFSDDDDYDKFEEDETSRINAKIDGYCGELDRLKYQRIKSCYEIVAAMALVIQKTEEKRVREFGINNPYEIIFAFLYLIDIGDDLAWIPQVPDCICGYASQLFPWFALQNDEMYDILEESFCTESSEKKNGKNISEADEIYDDDKNYEDDYALKYTDAYVWHRVDLEVQPDKLMPRNIAQIIYSDSHVVPPRFQGSKFESAEAFIDSGFNPEEAELFRFYKGLIRSAADKYDFFNVQYTEEKINAQKAEEKKELTVKELSEIIKLKNKEIENLNSKLYSSGKEVEKLNETIRKMKEQSSEESKELYELRELIYKLQNDSESDSDTEESGISFPYRTAERVVVYGGHATWLKVIVKLLPNVKFIDPYDTPDVNLIRNADVVWMQTNAMPHNKYSKIMEIVRSKKIPVKYFGYASAEKCADQLAQYDKMKLTSNLQ